MSIFVVISPCAALVERFRGHDFKDFAKIFDRKLNLVLGVVSPTSPHSGCLLDIVSSVFGVRDT